MHIYSIIAKTHSNKNLATRTAICAPYEYVFHMDKYLTVNAMIIPQIRCVPIYTLYDAVGKPIPIIIAIPK